MLLFRSRHLSALALILILGTAAPAAPPAASPRILAPAQLAYHRSQLGQRASLARDHLQACRAGLGLSEREDFRVAKAFTNEIGEAIIRFDHYFAGRRVLGSQAIARVPFGGAVEAITHSVAPRVQVAGEPRLTPKQAVAAAIQRLDPKGFMQDAPRVEPVVFPARLLGGIETILDPATGAHRVDRARSVQTKLASSYVWAYEVHTRLHNPQDGLKELTYYIDAGTGSVLRVVDQLHRQVAPMMGTGKGLYCGTPLIPAAQMADGTFALYDPTRGTAPNPALQGYTPDGSGWTPTGLQVWYEAHDGTGAPTGNVFLFQSNPANTWGDGLPFTAWGSENGLNGQTAGVDAMYGMALTWDLFQNVFGRAGMDGTGTSSFAEVLLTGPNDRDNAYWSNWARGLYLGAGNYPADPAGLGVFTELDVVAHEMTHGMTASTAQFTNSPGFEEAGLDEGTSDFFAQMAKAYAIRSPEASASEIPDEGADWRMGYQVGHGTPLRWMDKPSRDHRSVDAWYDGLHYLDGHFSCGVLNRALFFLARGASANPADPTYSPYLPQGMTGLGNDKAARIWFKTVTERLASGYTGSITYADAREQAIIAAKQLYGYTPKGYPWDCPESEAVENAFAATNVGRAYGEAPRTQVRFADWRDNDYIQRNHSPESGWAHKQFLPMGEAVRPRVTVLNTTNTAVTWSLGGPSVYNNGAIPGSSDWVTAGGVINADGTWTTPNQVGWFAITATSQADPRQFAEGRAFIVNLDADQDGESDAVDMGAAAFSWGMWPALNPSHSPLNQPAVGDEDVAIFPDAIKSTWWMK
jgi:Zn-dependent metalloprotease